MPLVTHYVSRNSSFFEWSKDLCKRYKYSAVFRKLKNFLIFLVLNSLQNILLFGIYNTFSILLNCNFTESLDRVIGSIFQTREYITNTRWNIWNLCFILLYMNVKKLREVDLLFPVFYGFSFNGNKVLTTKLHAWIITLLWNLFFREVMAKFWAQLEIWL